MANDVISLFMKVGLPEQRAKETAKNEVLSQTLKEVILQVRELVIELTDGVALYIWRNDVTESMVTIRSPFCGYNLT